MFLNEVLPALLLILAALWIPESPRYLVATGRDAEALAVLWRFDSFDNQRSAGGHDSQPSEVYSSTIAGALAPLWTLQRPPAANAGGRGQDDQRQAKCKVALKTARKTTCKWAAEGRRHARHPVVVGDRG